MHLMIIIAAVCIGTYIWLYVTSPEPPTLEDNVREYEETLDVLRHRFWGNDEE